MKEKRARDREEEERRDIEGKEGYGKEKEEQRRERKGKTGEKRGKEREEREREGKEALLKTAVLEFESSALLSQNSREILWLMATEVALRS